MLLIFFDFLCGIWCERSLSDDRMKAILTVQVSMGFLYEAKYDVIQQRSHAATRTGKYQTD